MSEKDNKNLPEIRFDGFNEGWEKKQLADVTNYATSNLTASDSNNNGNFPLYDANGIIGKTNENIQTEEYISIIKDGSGAGRTRKLPANSSFIGTMGAIKGKNADTDFIFALLQNVDFTQHITGATIPHVYYSDYGKETVSTPSIEEQKKIAEFFKQLDRLIELNEKKVEKLEVIKKSLLEKMFPVGGATVPQIRFNGFGDFWSKNILGKYCKIVGGGTPSTGISEFWDGDIDWYSPVEISNQSFLNGSQRKITLLGYENSSAKMLPIGSVLFTSRAGIGKMAILNKEGCTNQGFQSIVPNESRLDSYFIFSRKEELKRYGDRVGAGSTFTEVSGKQMSDMELFMPSTLDEQKRIGVCFKEIDKAIVKLQNKTEKLKNLKNTFLKKMIPHTHTHTHTRNS